MRKKDKLLASLDSFTTKEILRLMDINKITSYFMGYQHEEGLTHIDPALLDIVYEKFQDIAIQDGSQEMDKVNEIKTDVLNTGKPSLLSFCRNKGLVSLFQYMFTIKNRSHKSHSYYGLKLVNNYPGEFEVGTKCTHYHCKTTARSIQEQYGIYNPKDESIDEEKSQKQEEEDQDFDFIANSSEESSSEAQLQPVQSEKKSNKLSLRKKNGKKENKSQKKMNKDESVDQEQESIPMPSKKRKRDLLNSESQREEKSSSELIMIRKRDKNKNKTQNKGKRLQQTADVAERRQREMLELLQSLSQEQILDHYGYKTIFEYLAQQSLDSLLACLDKQEVFLTIQINKSNKKKPKKLHKNKINVKTITLEEIIAHCRKEKMKTHKNPTEYDQKDHVILGQQLIELFPKRFQMQGQFKAYQDEAMDKVFEDEYKRLQVSDQDDDNDEALIDDGQQQQADEVNYII